MQTILIRKQIIILQALKKEADEAASAKITKECMESLLMIFYKNGVY